MNTESHWTVVRTGLPSVCWRILVVPFIAVALLLTGLTLQASPASATVVLPGANAGPWPSTWTQYTYQDGTRISDLNGDQTPVGLDLASGTCAPAPCAGPESSVAYKLGRDQRLLPDADGRRQQRRHQGRAVPGRLPRPDRQRRRRREGGRRCGRQRRPHRHGVRRRLRRWHRRPGLRVPLHRRVALVGSDALDPGGRRHRSVLPRLPGSALGPEHRLGRRGDRYLQDQALLRLLGGGEPRHHQQGPHARQRHERGLHRREADPVRADGLHGRLRQHRRFARSLAERQRW